MRSIILLSSGQNHLCLCFACFVDCCSIKRVFCFVLWRGVVWLGLFWFGVTLLSRSMGASKHTQPRCMNYRLSVVAFNRIGTGILYIVPYDAYTPEYSNKRVIPRNCGNGSCAARALCTTTAPGMCTVPFVALGVGRKQTERSVIGVTVLCGVGRWALYGM